LTFAVPITARIPVPPLEPGQIPVQVEIMPENSGLLIAPTDLVYDGASGIIEMRNITHFSENWLMYFYQHVENACRQCDTYYDVWATAASTPEGIVATITSGREDNSIYQSDFCEAYAKDFWQGQQPGCCLLLREEREKCAPDCRCCMQELMEVESSGVDAAFGDCGIVSSDVTVRYPTCSDQTPQISTEWATASECPADMMLSIKIQPTRLDLAIGEQKDLNEVLTVSLSGTTPDGRTAFGPIQLVPIWSSEDPGIASVSSVNSKDFVCGVKVDETTLNASLSENPQMPTEDVNVVVKPRDMDGVWTLIPLSQEERCRFNFNNEWFDEDDFGAFDIQLAKTGVNDISASMVGVDSIMLGSWDSTTGAFTLATDTTSECRFLFDLYGEEICGDAIDCQFARCTNKTTIKGKISRGNTNLKADVSWYYSVTFSYAATSTRGETTWECEGSSEMIGSTKREFCRK
jgi:hypothetical protein